MAFPADLPFTNPYLFYFGFLIWVPLLVRILVIGPMAGLMLRHEENLKWVVKLLWDLPGGKRVIFVFGWGLVLPVVLGGGLRISLSLLHINIAWDTWGETPVWAAAIFLLAIAVFWVWEGFKIVENVRFLRKVDEFLKKKKTVAAAKVGISAAKKVFGFLSKQTELDEDSGVVERSKAKVAGGLLGFGRRRYAKIQEKMDKNVGLMMWNGFLAQWMVFLVLMALAVLDRIGG